MTNIALDGTGSLQQQICRGLRQAIHAGDLKPNSRLAPSRTFAEEHGVSRNTVTAAYEQLIAEGYLDARQGAGTYVSALELAGMASEPRRPQFVPAWSDVAGRVAEEVPEQLMRQPRRNKLRYDFLYGEPSYDELPLDRWSRIIGRCARELTEAQLGYGPVAGLLELRQELASYLGRSRGVRCDAEQIFIVQGTQEAIDLAVRAFVDAGDQAVLEEPRYRGFVRCLLAAGAELHSIPVDRNGLITAALPEKTSAKIALVTPSHQFPYGSIMSLDRRQHLLGWAKRQGTIVLEDDYDGEFRYEGRPIPSLQSLDDAGLVIYVGTASKMLFPAMRLGWMVVPKHMVNTFARLRSLSDASGNILEQKAFAQFIAHGHLERHIHKTRRAHQERRRELLSILHQELGDDAVVSGTEAGIHVLVRLMQLPQKLTDEVILRAAQKHVGAYSSALYYENPPAQAELLLGYASLSTRQIRTGIQRLAAVVRTLAAELH